MSRSRSLQICKPRFSQIAFFGNIHVTHFFKGGYMVMTSSFSYHVQQQFQPPWHPSRMISCISILCVPLASRGWWQQWGQPNGWWFAQIPGGESPVEGCSSWNLPWFTRFFYDHPNGGWPWDFWQINSMTTECSQGTGAQMHPQFFLNCQKWTPADWTLRSVY